MLAATVGPAGGASTGTVVGARVPSAVTVDSTACNTTPGATDFGTLVPGTATRTTADCVVTFGSSNNSSQLLVRQADAVGEAMFRIPSGTTQAGWGVSGVRTFDVNGADRPYAAATMQDGGTVIVTDGTTGGSPTLLRMIRLDPSGTYDAAFGTVTLPIRDGTDGSVDGLGGLIVDSSGRIVVAGTTPGHDTTVARYLANGTPDTTFGTAGVTSVNIGGGAIDDRAVSVTELRNGDLLTTGWTNPTDATLMRLNDDGSINTSFGGGDGITVINLGEPGSDEGLLAVVERSNGQLIAVGGALTSAGRYAVTRFSADGVPDPTFGGGTGRVNVAGISSAGAFLDAIELPDGKLLALAIDAATGAVNITRLTMGATATVDTTYGTSGLAAAGVLPQWSTARMVATPTYVTVASGVSSGDIDTTVRRFTASGAPDTTFGTNGVVTIDHAAASTDFGATLVRGQDGSLLVVGPANGNGVAMRLGSTTLLGYDDAANRDWATADTPFFGVCLSSTANAAATWPTSAGCPASDGTHWRAMPAAASQVATAATTQTGTATFRFGMRAPTSAAPGAYEAPITFLAIAP